MGQDEARLGQRAQKLLEKQRRRVVQGIWYGLPVPSGMTIRDSCFCFDSSLECRAMAWSTYAAWHECAKFTESSLYKPNSPHYM